MKSILIEPQYAGTCSYWKLMLDAEFVVFDIHEHYVKRSFRNRACILGANGLLQLSIPLESGKSQHSAFKDVRISYKEDWQKHHWQSLLSAYSRSPYFEYYEHHFLPLYEKKPSFLLDWNLDLFRLLQNLLKQEIKFELSAIYKKKENCKETDCRNLILPRNINYESFPAYTQVFSDRMPFVEDLSILDLLFNTGNRSVDFLKQIRLNTHF